MNDPYKVLGVSPDASPDEIKKAYRELVRKYHPDNYHDNPLEDLAQEKMKEINEAYDAIQRGQAAGNYSDDGPYQKAGQGAYQNSYQGAYQKNTGSGKYAQVRAAINNGNIQLAENMLRQMQNHDAEWYFLMGSISYRKGWLDEAKQHYQRAVSMDPNNPEYAQALRYMNNAGGYYRPAETGVGNIDACSCCSSLWAADCCCECLGGDLVRCC